MISFIEAQSIVEELSKTIKNSEQVALFEGLNRILFEDVYSDIDMPPFNKSAMDGYACRMDDIDKPLNLLGVIRAGDNVNFTIEKGDCVQIMTGGRMPQSSDCVIVVEETTINDAGKVVFTGNGTKENFVLQAYDIKKGDIVLKKGIFIKPQHIAVMASVGYVKPVVYQKTKVAVISTGDEIVEPHILPTNTQIRNSNASQLLAQIRNMGASPIYMGIVADDKNETEQVIKRAMEIADVVLLTGGVSMGEYDFVPEILIKLGVDIKFDKVAVKPGRPTVFGVAENCYVFGLPGNPVSSFSIFEIFVRPLIFKTMGHNYIYPELLTSINEDFKRRSDSRTEWFPIIRNEDGTVSPVDYHGSAHIHALCNADGSMKIKVGVKEIKKGETVHVRLF